LQKSVDEMLNILFFGIVASPNPSKRGE